MSVETFLHLDSYIDSETACNLIDDIIETNKNKDIKNYIQPSNSEQYNSIFTFIKNILINGIKLKNNRYIELLSCKDDDVAIVYNEPLKKLSFMVIE